MAGGRLQPAAKVLAVSCWIVAIAATTALVVEYWLGANTQMLGGLAALPAIAAGMGLTLWVHGFARQEEVRGERVLIEASDEEWGKLAGAVTDGAERVGRRRFLVAAMVAFAGMVTVTLVSFLRAMMPRPPREVLWHTPWKAGTRAVRLDGSYVRADDFPVDAVVTVFPEGHIGELHGATLLIHVKESLLELPADRKKWAVGGIVAYSRICTHAGCPVSQYEDTLHLMACHCHQSTFNILDGGTPTGGPASRPLPQLPIAVDPEGYLVAQSDYTRPVGPGFWGIPR